MKFTGFWETTRAFEYKIETRGKIWKRSLSNKRSRGDCLVLTMSTILRYDKLQSRTTFLLPSSSTNPFPWHTLYNLNLRADAGQNSIELHYCFQNKYQFSWLTFFQSSNIVQALIGRWRMLDLKKFSTHCFSKIWALHPHASIQATNLINPKNVKSWILKWTFDIISLNWKHWTAIITDRRTAPGHSHVPTTYSLRDNSEVLHPSAPNAQNHYIIAKLQYK